MISTPVPLPNDLETLKQLVADRDGLIAKLLAEIARLKRWQFGRSSERIEGTLLALDDLPHAPPPDPDFDPPPRVERDDRVTLTAALGSRKSFVYFYDFGDGWEHRVTVEKILPADAGLKLPQCLDGANACPPEDVGGPPGYADFLEAIRDPAHEEHDAMLEWCGGTFDPAAFRPDDINATLHQFKL